MIRDVPVVSVVSVVRNGTIVFAVCARWHIAHDAVESESGTWGGATAKAAVTYPTTQAAAMKATAACAAVRMVCFTCTRSFGPSS
jgi:hypothetical protein